MVVGAGMPDKSVAAVESMRDFCSPVTVKRHLDMHKRSQHSELPRAAPAHVPTATARARCLIRIRVH
jgi:hypothetical protein